MNTRPQKSNARHSAQPERRPLTLESAPEPEPAEPRQDTGSLQRGLMVLDAITRAERPVTSGEVAELVGLSLSTTHRLLGTLTDLGYIFRDSAKRYYPTARTLFPANLFHPLNVFRRISVEQLASLREQFGLASSCLIFLGGKRWVLETIHGYDALSPYSGIEVSDPPHATVAGKILLSTLTMAKREALMGPPPYERLTLQTITSGEALEEELAGIERDGCAKSVDEMLSGLSAVGAPIWCAPKQPLGALVLAGPTRNVRARMEEIKIAVKQAAGLLSFASPGVRAVCRFIGQ